MFAGTGSDVGKSIIAAAFCRILKQDGYCPAPFKAQNMALNSFVTKDGLELGRAQAVQAEAAGISCLSDMNPILLKPQSDHTSQIVLNGRPIGNKDAYDYFSKDNNDVLRKEAYAAFDRLSNSYNPIVIEGAGSISEINLRERDIVNMAMAIHADAGVILVADIDRGGVFASVYGSIALLSPEEKTHIKGILINKFRGDLRLFDSGKKMMEDICGVPVVGVVPYYKDIYIDEEDSVDLTSKSRNLESGKINIAVILVPHLSNFTDFNALEQDSRVHLFYTDDAEDIEKADIIVLPGSKSTIADLCELRKKGLAEAIIKAANKGSSIIGICGGYQMLGAEISDPECIEGNVLRIPGLNILPIKTTITNQKRTTCDVFTLAVGDNKNDKMEGYEIHMGRTVPLHSTESSPLTQFLDGRTDGYYKNGKCMGTYIHGILDNMSFIDFILAPFSDKINKTVCRTDYKEFKELQYNKLADHVRAHVNMNLIYKIFGYNE